MRVAQGKRSAALGSEAIMNIPSLHGLPCRPDGSARQTVKRGLRRAVGYPGRQSLRAFALGYYLVAPSGRQTEPPASAMKTLTRIWPNKPDAAKSGRTFSWLRNPSPAGPTAKLGRAAPDPCHPHNHRDGSCRHGGLVLLDANQALVRVGSRPRYSPPPRAPHVGPPRRA